ncbi:amidohydrolase family protein [Pseudomonas aeruginosa]|uniref:amidohydrolase family protein n=1 Tax=Pseudomonas aeruginosa TaxID=287 RepID=UPI002935F90D|nr:amidohydrolase family protein [Pseudomonas aeruginosa]MDV2702579.1 amidohydrolase family protein [Pseudomonas aeruginosa]
MANFLKSVGGNKQVLLGRIVTLDDVGTVYDHGALCIADDRIVAVVSNLALIPSSFAGVQPIETHGTLFPGLIELHNHLSYNFLPLWSVPKRYTNRNQWREQEPEYDVAIKLPAQILGSNTGRDYARSIARFVECRALLGGTTTVQGLSSSGTGGKKWYQGLTRNVEAPRDPAFPAASGQTLDYKPAEIVTDLVPALQKNRPFFYHLSEGTDADARQRFLDLQYAPNTWAIDRDLITIHCTALAADHFQHLKAAAGMVWSPLSNLLLYGETADVAAAKAAGIAIALGSDWSPSGSKNLLGELKIARLVSARHGDLFNAEELVRMVTSTPARMLGWHGLLGSLELGKKADILILEGADADPYEQLIQARENQILAVVINGRPRHGRMGLLGFDAQNQERVVIGGKDYALDLTEAGDDPLAGLSLTAATALLAEGLANLPNLATKAPEPNTMAFSLLEQQALSIDFDLEEEEAFSSLQAAIRKAAPALRSLPMAAITAVDDPDYHRLLKANINLPDYVKDAL